MAVTTSTSPMLCGRRPTASDEGLTSSPPNGSKPVTSALTLLARTYLLAASTARRAITPTK